MPYAGEAAALATAFLWSFTSIFFSEAGQRIGSLRVNKIRLLMAAVIYACVMWFTSGTPVPLGINGDALFWLCLSSLIGLVIGDTFLFKAFTDIGPRLTTLIFASSPIMATIVAWVFLDEKLGGWELIGIVVTLSGIAWVVLERRLPSDKFHTHGKQFTTGVVYAFIGSFGQAVGLVTSKEAMLNTGVVIDPFEASFVRIIFAVVVIWIVALVRHKLSDTLKAVRNREAMLFTLGGTIVGPFLGIWMSLVAVSLIAAGVAATLNSMVPVLVIPLVIFYYKEKVSPRAVIGALVAVGGVAILFLS
jgi:drug/metabolite transporter (DMT)-like permease